VVCVCFVGVVLIGGFGGFWLGVLFVLECLVFGFCGVSFVGFCLWVGVVWVLCFDCSLVFVMC